MPWFLYLAVGVTVVMFGGIFVGFIVAAIMDWNYRRKNRVFIELQRDHNERRRPAAK